MASLTIYAGLSYSNAITVAAVTGENSVQLVWAYEQDSSPDRWKLEKTAAVSNNSITAELSAAETAEYTHIKWFEWYYISSSTGSKRWGGSYPVVMSKIAGSRDTTSTIPRHELGFVKFGQAAVGLMQNTYTMPASSSISKLTLTASNAPLTTDLVCEVYVNAVASGKTVTLPAGSTAQTTTLAPALIVAYADVITFRINSTGTSPDEGTNVIGGVWYY